MQQRTEEIAVSPKRCCSFNHQHSEIWHHTCVKWSALVFSPPSNCSKLPCSSTSVFMCWRHYTWPNFVQWHPKSKFNSTGFYSKSLYTGLALSTFSDSLLIALLIHIYKLILAPKLFYLLYLLLFVREENSKPKTLQFERINIQQKW